MYTFYVYYANISTCILYTYVIFHIYIKYVHLHMFLLVALFCLGAVFRFWLLDGIRSVVNYDGYTWEEESWELS